MSAVRWPLALAAVLLGSLLTPPAASAAVPPDVLDSYTIAITPQFDGMLTMTYTLAGYHVMSDWPSSEPYLQVGVPNGSFSITNSGSSNGTVDVSNVEAVSGNAGSFVQFDFGTLPRSGEVFDLHFTISQGQMAYPDTVNNQVTFKFIPAAWTFPITVRRLAVSWANPSSPSLLKLVQPAPTNGDTAMTWRWDGPSISSGMFADDSVELAYDQSAFTLSDSAAATSDSGNGGNGGSGGGGSVDPGIAILVIIVVGLVAFALGRFLLTDDNFGRGPGIHPGAGGFHGGGFVGGHSCACACAGCACACACACAGGGRVGCSRKAIGIECLPKAIRIMTELDQREQGALQ